MNHCLKTALYEYVSNYCSIREHASDDREREREGTVVVFAMVECKFDTTWLSSSNKFANGYTPTDRKSEAWTVKFNVIPHFKFSYE